MSADHGNCKYSCTLLSAIVNDWLAHDVIICDICIATLLATHDGGGHLFIIVRYHDDDGK